MKKKLSQYAHSNHHCSRGHRGHRGHDGHESSQRCNFLPSRVLPFVDVADVSQDKIADIPSLFMYQKRRRCGVEFDMGIVFIFTSVVE